jgi:hypothetical protein
VWQSQFNISCSLLHASPTNLFWGLCPSKSSKQQPITQLFHEQVLLMGFPPWLLRNAEILYVFFSLAACLLNPLILLFVLFVFVFFFCRNIYNVASLDIFSLTDTFCRYSKTVQRYGT